MKILFDKINDFEFDALLFLFNMQLKMPYVDQFDEHMGMPVI